MLLEINEKDICHNGDLGVFTEMASIGITDDNYEVYVNSNDGGKIPHFHYRNPDDWKSFHTCIRIDDAGYFHHGNKDCILNSKQRKNLIKFLRSAPKDRRFKTNWDYIVYLWNTNNSDTRIDKYMMMPNYNSL